MLTSSPKILHVNKRHFFQLNVLGCDRWIWERCCDADFNSAWAHLPCRFSSGPLKRDFLDICQDTFSESEISEIQNLLWSSLIQKVENLIELSKMQQKIEKKNFLFLR